MKRTIYQYIALSLMLLFLIGLVSLLPETSPHNATAKVTDSLSLNDKE